jgi:hypothetical protein
MRKKFFEKGIDKLKILWYNFDRKTKERKKWQSILSG